LIRQSTNDERSAYYLTAAQAAAELGISRATLYAYASRRQLRSEPVPGRPHERRYVREDVERLRERKLARRDPSRAAAHGLSWGGPVLDSSLTLIERGSLYYRGQNVIELASTATLEHVAALLWSADDTECRLPFDQACPLPNRDVAVLARLTDDPVARIQMALAIAESRDIGAHDLRPVAFRRTAARLLQVIKIVMGCRDARVPVHEALQRAWRANDRAAGNAIRSALVLCADHELNVSAFTARCAASAGATAYDVVSSALATFKGRRHGGASEHVLALLSGANTPKAAKAAIARTLQLENRIPGFGHPLYPGGDPRAAMLLSLARNSRNGLAWRTVRNLWRAGSDATHEPPNLDFGLAAIAKAYALPERAPSLLFAIGRVTGWIGHAIEEYASGRPIRLRARYVGPAPTDGSAT
jgi:citrate synthase